MLEGFDEDVIDATIALCSGKDSIDAKVRVIARGEKKANQNQGRNSLVNSRVG
jgi:hypothetical protein